MVSFPNHPSCRLKTTLHWVCNLSTFVWLCPSEHWQNGAMKHWSQVGLENWSFGVLDFLFLILVTVIGLCWWWRHDLCWLRRERWSESGAQGVPEAPSLTHTVQPRHHLSAVQCSEAQSTWRYRHASTCSHSPRPGLRPRPVLIVPRSLRAPALPPRAVLRQVLQVRQRWDLVLSHWKGWRLERPQTCARVHSSYAPKSLENGWQSFKVCHVAMIHVDGVEMVNKYRSVA